MKLSTTWRRITRDLEKSGAWRRSNRGGSDDGARRRPRRCEADDELDKDEAGVQHSTAPERSWSTTCWRHGPSLASVERRDPADSHSGLVATAETWQRLELGKEPTRTTDAGWAWPRIRGREFQGEPRKTDAGKCRPRRRRWSSGLSPRDAKAAVDTIPKLLIGLFRFDPV